MNFFFYFNFLIKLVLFIKWYILDLVFLLEINLDLIWIFRLLFNNLFLFLNFSNKAICKIIVFQFFYLLNLIRFHSLAFVIYFNVNILIKLFYDYFYVAFFYVIKWVIQNIKKGLLYFLIILFNFGIFYFILEYQLNIFLNWFLFENIYNIQNALFDIKFWNLWAKFSFLKNIEVNQIIQFELLKFNRIFQINNTL